MTHSIGVDSARMVLDAYQAAEKINGPRDRRFRMEHADYLNPQDVPRFQQLVGDREHAAELSAAMRENWGNVKIDTWNSLLKAGAMVTFSSDWPCTWPPDPLVGIEEAVTREILRDVTPHGPVGENSNGQQAEKLSIEQAVLAYTRDAAYANFAEKLTGTLEAGQIRGPGRSIERYLLRQARRNRKNARHHDHGGRQDRLSAITAPPRAEPGL